jgi:hypothetical protein
VEDEEPAKALADGTTRLNSRGQKLNPVLRPERPNFALLTFLFLNFGLSTSIPVLTTSTYVVAWPQGDQFLGGDL